MHTSRLLLFLLHFVTLLFGLDAQNIELESSLLRCHDDNDVPHKDPIHLATSKKGQTLDVKVHSRCRKKLLITLRITESSKRFVPDVLILVNKTKNTLTQRSSKLGIPVAVKIHQDRVLQKYPLHFLYRVSAKLSEEVINVENKANYTGCDSSPQSANPTCGFVHSNSEVKHVAGFCCGCKDHNNNIQQRGGHRCDAPNKSPEVLTSSHCLRRSPHLYNVYELDEPSLFQKLTFEVFKGIEGQNRTITWSALSEAGSGVKVDSDHPGNVSGDLQVLYRPNSETVTDAAAALSPMAHRLLLPQPSPFVKPSDYPEPLRGPAPEQILIVSKSLLAPLGTHCDRVGTRIGAFLSQPEPCRRAANSCLKNQPFDLWKQDQGPHGDPKSKFRLSSFGGSGNNRNHSVDFTEDYATGSLFMEHKADTPTFVDIEIPADDLIILSPGYNAFIESVLTDTGLEGGKIVTQIMNKELVPAEYSMELVHCYANLTSKLKTKPKIIGPLSSKMFHQDLRLTDILHPMKCFVSLINEFGESVAAREIILSPHETCVCVHTCECACGDKKNLKCSRLSDDNIVAAGLVSEVKTDEELDKDEDLRYHQRWKRVFHAFLIFHCVLLLLMMMGLLKGVIGLMCCKPLAEFGMDYFRDREDKEDTSNRDLICYNSSFFLCLPLIIIWWIVKGRHQQDAKADSDSEEEGPLGETDVDLVNISNSSEGSDVTLFRKGMDPSASTEALAGSIQSRRPESQISIHDSKSRPPPSTRGPSTTSTAQESASEPVMPSISAVASAKTAAEQWKTYKKDENLDMARLAGPGTGISERSLRVKGDPEPLRHPGSGGPQNVRSVESPLNNNSDGLVDLNLISACSSKSSFGAWHRRRKDQYSAYDFLPEPKAKGSSLHY